MVVFGVIEIQGHHAAGQYQCDDEWKLLQLLVLDLKIGLKIRISNPTSQKTASSGEALMSGAQCLPKGYKTKKPVISNRLLLS